MADLPGASVQAVICDPPYGLSFMGVAWDSYSNERRAHVPQGDISDKMGRVCRPHNATEQAWTRGRENKAYETFNLGWLAEVHRVLVAGGVVKAFGGTRTFHRLVHAFETVGFEEIRVEAWGYGSGFPKSVSISKAIDKRPGAHGRYREIKLFLREAIRASGKTRAQIDRECGFHACDFARTDGSSPFVGVIPDARKWATMKAVIGFGDEWDTAVNEAEREVIATGRSGRTAIWSTAGGAGEFAVTTAGTAEAALWEGWGTALKPAWEPVVVGRKP